ncbi:4-alpha-glucanotransferase [Corynebacterium sp. sy017]|uniref:4-alpha-glucanotransferase n=1 Tax=unclassified Corynebacterium TaxID=2624378 RepID=UPI001184FB33|nr:4-alpha-glucanotransferase [Corynebacterium sp. SY003]MBP3088072.1 4-alpha-glucanotransferase [Corynebacterium sp. sy017]TSD92598.1 4-alpha-glucanotransferase [Corynebacterium sp. SY003]
MSYQETLHELAATYHIATGYHGFGGEYITASNDTILKILHAYGVTFDKDTAAAGAENSANSDAPTEDQLRHAIQARHNALFSQPLPPAIVAVAGDPHVFHVHVHDGAPADLEIQLEDGSLAYPEQIDNWTPPRTIDGITWGEASFKLPVDLPLGWHTLTLRSHELRASAFLVITPERLHTADTFLDKPAHGVMAQLYSVRSKNSWGMGDFHDLGQLAQLLATEAEADFLLINPLHAAEPFPPVEDSPYLPTTRRFINPIYIRIEDIPEYLDLSEDIKADVHTIANELRALNHSSDTIDRNRIYQAKLQVLQEIFHIGRAAAREQDFQDFITDQGEGLKEFALWCAQEHKSHHADSETGAHALPEDITQTAEFYMWLQWICDQQLAAAQSQARDAGMRIGIIADLAVGIHPGGADAHTLASVLAPEASVGAPPDNYNQHGQDWSQPPWHPERLAEQGYIPWRDLLRTVLAHCGGIRVDHILGLFRLFWIPRLQPAATGIYVHYDYNALIGILALEATRANAVVIGEDLGTFEPWIQHTLAHRGIMGTSILWFESSEHHPGPRYQEEYRQLALSSVTTHDLPPTAGYLAGTHVALRQQLGLLGADSEQSHADHAQDMHWQAEVLNRVKEQGAFSGLALDATDFHSLTREERGDVVDILVGLHRFIAATPSALTCTALVDMVGDTRIQNQPGTTKDMYPNWCIPLSDASGKALLLEDLAGLEQFARIAQASRRLAT